MRLAFTSLKQKKSNKYMNKQIKGKMHVEGQPVIACMTG